MIPESAPLLGTLLHAIGAASAALCYAPQRYLHRWSWQTYWLVQASGCWLVLPWIFAWFTIPELSRVLAEAPATAMWRSYLFGVLYGVGGIAFGLAIRYIGFSLTYAIAIGVSCVFGTLLPPWLAGTLGATLGTSAGTFVVAGVFLGGGAMVVTGLAGFRK
ncbi:MAG TPA: L-rhamnose/proton symporter RhaT, partial [Candidatus Synoicihabitans sp.]|nr:L-rhamnose/proton symporter RhaT [Candidatus Synoicihabitans sp.]